MAITLSPIIFAALGAASSFYWLFPVFRRGLLSTDTLLVLLCIPVVILCLFWVLASLPAGSSSRLIRLIPVRAAAFLAGLALGISAGVQAVPGINIGIPPNTVSGITGTMLDDPRLISGGRAMSAISLETVMNAGGVRAASSGDITVFFQEESAGRLREFGRGAQVFAEGILRIRDDGTYTFNAESLHITQVASPLERFRTNLRMDLTRRFASDPWGGLALALLLGIRDNLDTDLAVHYRNAGCSFILALSGMHLAVIIAVISFLLTKPLGLRPAAIIGACFIVIYCFIVGPLPSLYRAALMYLLGVLAVLGMFRRDPLVLLCMAFLIQLAVTPPAGNSISFILSYLALAGIVIIGGIISNVLKGYIPALILHPVSASLGAFIATAGVSAWFFNDLRPVGILASLIIAPLTTLFMVGSMVWLSLDMIHTSLSFVIGKPLSLVYRLLEITASLASYIPGIRVHSLMVFSASLLLTGLLIWFHYRRTTTGRPELFT